MSPLLPLLTGLAHAQSTSPNVTAPPIDGDLLHRAIATQRTLVTEDAGRIEDQARFTAQLATGYANGPLLVSWGEGDSREQFAVLGDVVGVSVIPALAFDRFRLGLELPFYPVATSDLTTGGLALGNVALDGRLTALDPREAPVGLGLLARVDLASPDSRRSIGSDRVGFELGAAAERSFGAVHLGLNAGYRGIPRVRLYNVIVDDWVFLRASGAYDVSEQLGVTLEAVGHTIPAMISPDVAPIGDPQGAPTPIEALVGAWAKPHETLRVQAALGGGLTSGLGAPRFRALLDVTFSPNIEIGDRDDDGVRDRVDACPQDVEDLDGFQDEDGCPDWDNDGDGVDDQEDACPDDAEDIDGFRDDDGCPDPTTSVLIRVVDERGEPVPGAILQISGEGLEPTATQDLDLHPGEYEITAFAPGHQANETAFRVREGAVGLADAQSQLVQVVLPKHPPGKVQLLVETATGASLPDDLEVRVAGEPVRLVDGSVTVEVDAGSVPIAIGSSDRWGAHWQRIAVKSDAMVPITVTLRRSSIRVSTTGNGDDAETVVSFRTPVRVADGKVEAASQPALGEVLVLLQELRGGVEIEAPEAATGEAIEAWFVKQGIADQRIEVVPDAGRVRIRVR